MARRNQSTVDDLIELTMLLPWWLSVIIAVVSYLLLHWYVSSPLPPPADVKDMSGFLNATMLRTVAAAAQYLLPLIFLSGAALSLFLRHKRRTLHDRVVAQGNRQSIEKLSWREFEYLVGEFFRRKGFTVEETGGDGPDGGVDLIASLGKDSYFIQCKHWKAMQVGVTIVRELYGVMAANGAAGGFVVTSGAFTEEAKRFAEGREIEIISGEQLLGETRNAVPGKASESPSIDKSTCPLCGAVMVKRVARKGANTGNSFWGCSTYPACRGTRPT